METSVSYAQVSIKEPMVYKQLLFCLNPTTNSNIEPNEVAYNTSKLCNFCVDAPNTSALHFTYLHCTVAVQSVIMVNGYWDWLDYGIYLTRGQTSGCVNKLYLCMSDFDIFLKHTQK